MQMLRKLTAKCVQVARFLRYGPGELEQVRRDAAQVASRARVEQLEEKLHAFESGTQTMLHELTLAVMAKAADADLQFVRNSLAAQLQREAGWLRDRISLLDRPAAATAPPDAAAAAPQATTGGLEEAFYPALERQFRGTQDEIRARLEPYRAWIDGAPGGPVGDLGCGRGEWLELLRAWGRQGKGIDLNALNVEQGRGRGLDMECTDALQWLRQQAPASMAALTSFHLVEHLPFGTLLQMVDEARRVLMPGGVLIMETPNPENPGVATHSFWLDPTHRKPIPPALLEFVASHAGLQVEATLRLNPPDAGTADFSDPALRAWAMQGRDYAVVARKPGQQA